MHVGSKSNPAFGESLESTAESGTGPRRPRHHASSPTYPLDPFPVLPLMLGFVACYVAAVAVGYALRVWPQQFSVLWPPAGVLGPVLACVSARRWGPIVGVALTVESIAGLIMLEVGQPFGVRFPVLAIALVANATNGIAFAVLYQRLIGPGIPERAVPAFGRFLACIIVPTGIVSFVAMSLFQVFRDDISMADAWPQWWISDATGMIVFGPPILLGLRLAADRRFAFPPLGRTASTTAIVAVTSVTAGFVFGLPHSDGAMGHYAILLMLPLLAWPIARLEPFTITLQLVGIALAVTGGLVEATGPFVHVDRTVQDNIRHAQAVLLPVCISVLFISALLEHQRRQGDRRLANERRIRHLERIEFLGSVAAGVAHDFGNLSIAVSANQAVIRRGVRDPDPAVERAISGLGDAATAASALTRSLLALAEPDELEEAESIELDEAIRHAVSIIEPLLEQRAVVRLDLGPGPVRARIRPVAVQRIVGNLIVNACDAGGEGQPIDVRLRGTDDSAIIEVSDRGSGMSPEVVRQAFDPFFTTKPRGRGTGLGLAIVQRLVADAGGTVSVAARKPASSPDAYSRAGGPGSDPVAGLDARTGPESDTDPGPGTVVTITLPRTDAGTARPGIHAPPR